MSNNSLPEEKKPLNNANAPCKCESTPDIKTGRDIFKCPICDLRLASEDEYNHHVEVIHKMGSQISTPIY